MEALFRKAKKLAKKEQKMSTPFLQRKLQIGYLEASMIIDMLEEAKIIGPDNETKPRIILIKK